MFNVGLESMTAQIRSKFGQVLDGLWEEVIKYRDTELKGKSYEAKKLAIKKMFRDNISKRFCDAVWKYTGLFVKRLELWDYSEGISFCTWICFDKQSEEQRGTLQIEEMLNGGYMHRRFPGYLSNKPYYDTEELARIAKSYDATKGVVTDAMKMEMRKMFRSVINFDITLAFLVEDQLPPNSGTTNFTAQEITAILLHEIGHTLTLVEHAGDCYARISTFKYLSAAWREAHAKDPKEVIHLAETTANTLESLGDKTNAERVRSIVTKFKKDYEVAGGQPSNNVLRIIGGMIEFCLAMFLDIFIVPLSVVCGGEQQLRFSHSEQKKKLGDIQINMRNITWQERKADEYAFSHGYGANQVTALAKLYAFFDREGLSERACRKLTEAERLHKSLGILQKFKLIVFMPHFANGYGLETYPAGVKRFREILNETLQTVKANANNPIYIKKYMEDCDTILKAMDNFNRGEEYTAKLMKAYDLFMRYFSLPSFVNWMVNGNIKRDIEDLIDEIDTVGNNLLTYYGIKFQQLAK